MARPLDRTGKQEFPIYDVLAPAITSWLNCVTHVGNNMTRLSSLWEEYSDMSLAKIMKLALECTDESVLGHRGRNLMEPAKVSLDYHMCWLLRYSKRYIDSSFLFNVLYSFKAKSHFSASRQTPIRLSNMSTSPYSLPLFRSSILQWHIRNSCRSDSVQSDQEQKSGSTSSVESLATRHLSISQGSFSTLLINFTTLIWSLCPMLKLVNTVWMHHLMAKTMRRGSPSNLSTHIDAPEVLSVGLVELFRDLRNSAFRFSRVPCFAFRVFKEQFRTSVPRLHELIPH